ncbi:MAG TPA: LytR C-terminal domain-containing protein [Gaiellaceae bacterium]|nr:LytR C-terminal domain-containing protein [Gaiellaceae bacterium]
MDHVAPLERSFPWRGLALAAGAVALAELVALLAVAGVRLAPSLRSSHPAATTAAAAPTHTTAARHAAPTRTTATATPAPLRPRSRVSVLVLNGNGITHAAANEAAALLRRGYRAAGSADAANHDYARSLVLFAPGYEREGRRLARDAGAKIVGPLDGMKPSQLKGSQLVVILGDS